MILKNTIKGKYFNYIFKIKLLKYQIPKGEKISSKFSINNLYFFHYFFTIILNFQKQYLVRLGVLDNRFLYLTLREFV